MAEEYLLRVFNETDKAMFVSDTDNDKDGHWIPKSQCEIIKTATVNLINYRTIEIPDWWAKRMGLA